MKMFVTGATGLLGSNLVRALRAEGHSVRALVRSKEKAQRQLGDSGVELVVGDMENVPGFGGALEGVDVLFHTAAYFREYYGAGNHWPKLEAINVRGTLALAEAARAHRVRRMIDTSSSGTIGLKPDGSPGDEDTPPAPVAKGNLYFKSKVLVAGQLQALAARTGLDVVQILPGWMFGPGDAAPTASGRLVLDFLAGKLPAVPPGGTSAVDARDVAIGMIRAAERGRAGEKYILGGDFVTLADVIRDARAGHRPVRPAGTRPRLHARRDRRPPRPHRSNLERALLALHARRAEALPSAADSARTVAADRRGRASRTITTTISTWRPCGCSRRAVRASLCRSASAHTSRSGASIRRRSRSSTGTNPRRSRGSC